MVIIRTPGGVQTIIYVENQICIGAMPLMAEVQVLMNSIIRSIRTRIIEAIEATAVYDDQALLVQHEAP
jgi:hypothetical protein